jgi:hypothetical protein
MLFVMRRRCRCWDEETVRDDQALSKESLLLDIRISRNDFNPRRYIGTSKRRC